MIYLSVFGAKTISSDKGSIDISDTFQLLYFVKKLWKYPSRIRVSENCFDPKSERDPENLFHDAGNMRNEISRICL